MKDTLIVITAAVAGTILGLLAVVMISQLIIAEALVVAAVAAYCFHLVEKRVKGGRHA